MSQNKEDQSDPNQKIQTESLTEEKEKLNLRAIKISDLELESEISQRMTTCVYRAKHIQTNKIFALKKIGYMDTIQQISNVVNEYHQLRDLRHSNIIPIYASFYSKGFLYILSELIAGCTLSDILQVSPQIPENILGIFAYQFLQGLKFLKSNHKFHKNLKPSNIFVTDKSEVKIDHPCLFSKSLNLFQSIPGPLCYLAPEVLREESYCFESDIWSFGLIIFQCVFGQFPLIDLNNPKVSNVWKIIANRSTDVDVKLPPFYSSELVDFISGCLKMDPKERANVDDLLNHEWIKRVNNEENQKEFVKWNESLQAQISQAK